MRFRALLVAVSVALLAAPAAQALTTFYGTVGPGATIVLKRASGTVVRNASRGNKTFVIRDRSASHNFHLKGPGGVDRRTRVAFVGTKTWTPVLLRIGRYTIVCDRHPLTMVKHFNVS
jgi:plastocyanin